MEKAKKDRLAAAGWRSGDAAEFLELSAEEAAFVELKLALADYLREYPRSQRLDPGSRCPPAGIEPVARRQDGGGGRLGLARPAGEVAAHTGRVAQRGRRCDRATAA